MTGKRQKGRENTIPVRAACSVMDLGESIRRLQILMEGKKRKNCN